MENGPMKTVMNEIGGEDQFLENLDPIKPQDLKAILPSAPDDAIDLLNDMLQFSTFVDSL